MGSSCHSSVPWPRIMGMMLPQPHPDAPLSLYCLQTADIHQTVTLCQPKLSPNNRPRLNVRQGLELQTMRSSLNLNVAIFIFGRGNWENDAPLFSVKNDALLVNPLSNTYSGNISGCKLGKKDIFGRRKSKSFKCIFCQPPWSIISHSRACQSWVCPRGEILFHP